MVLRCLIFLLLSTPLLANPAPHVSETGVSPQAVSVSVRPAARRMVVPEARWGTRNGRTAWTMTLLRGMRSHASILPEVEPRDIAAWCPAYVSAPREQREAFWVGLISSLAWHESTHRPGAVGGGGLWYGLTQIYPDTARRYGCKARSGNALKDPEDNLSCALRIMAVTVPRDQVVSHGMRGVAADWGPFHSRRKREDMRRYTASQSYCTALARSLRPVARPQPAAPSAQRPKARIIVAQTTVQ